jgi:CxxC-x17-CxxC domain-containing protein
VSYADKTLTCRDCGTAFVFTEGEQSFYAQKGFTNEPGRCPECRAVRKGQRGGGGGGGGLAYDSDRGYGGGRDYQRAPRQMFSATCSACGGTAQVPFEPRGDKPVYCSSCFEQQRSYR